MSGPVAPAGGAPGIASADALFAVDAVRFAYQGAAVLAGLSFTVGAGTRVALLGANGSGKSTLLRLLAGLDFAQEGNVRFAGEALTAARFADDAFAHGFRRRVGIVMQSADVQLFNPTVLDEVAFGPLQLGWPVERVRAAVDATLDALGIAHLRERMPHRLSGGEKRRVALASVLVLEPEVLLLDEPTAMLDPRSESGIIDLLVGWAGSGRTVITSTNDLDLVEDIADRCLVLEEGHLAADGAPAAIVADTALLRRCGLLHAHRHAHSGEVHAHPHLHGHRHGGGS